MRSFRENPDSEENQRLTRENQRAVFAATMEAAQEKEIACPNCYGGHFRPCQWCGDSGRLRVTEQ
jgi:hypothetical protein